MHSDVTSQYKCKDVFGELCSALAGESIAALRHKRNRKTTSTFRGNSEKNRAILQQGSYFRNFLENEHTMILFLKCDHIQLLELYILTKYRKIDMDFTIFSSSAKHKIRALIVNFSTLKSVIFRIFINVLHKNIASLLLFQNIGNKKTIRIKILFLVLQKLSLLCSSFLGCFIRKIAIICTIPLFSKCCISKSSTRWYILLVIISFILPYTTQKCRFHKIDMDFGFVASTLKAGLTVIHVATFQGMHVSPAKHSFAWLHRKCDYQTDRRRTKLSLCAAMLRRRYKKPSRGLNTTD